MRADHPNLELVRAVARALGPLRDRFVFLGGAATNLLITDPAVLRARGFAPDESPGAPRCRWRVGGVLLDVMATEPSVLGFANRWYPLACRTAQSISLDADLPIRVVTSPHFVATKLEAFHGRGGGDLHESPSRT